MKVPNAEATTIPARKLTGYLLDYNYPQNKGKAAFYEIVGFTKENVNELCVALLSHGLNKATHNSSILTLEFDSC